MSGVGKATIAPNTALVSLGVTNTATTVASAQNQANSIINTVTADLKTLGIEDKNIQTSNYNVSPNYDYTAGQKITGYTVSENLEVKVTPLDKINSVIDAATKDGANIVGGVTFTLDDKTKSDLEEKARTQAITNAKQKAQSLAGASGLQLGKIIDVQENNTSQPFPMVDSMLRVGRGDAANKTVVSPGETTVQTTVTLSYETF